MASSWRDKGADVRAFPLDVTDRAATLGVVAAIEQAFGRVDVAVHFPKPFSWIIKTLRILPYPLYQFIIRKATGDRQKAHSG